MAFNSLEALGQAGIDIDRFSPVQREVLSGLTSSEVAVVTSLKTKLEATEDDLEPHAFLEKLRELAGGYLF